MRTLAATLTAILLLVQPVWAYEVVVTPLTDQHFEPIIDETSILYWGSLESNTSRPFDIRLSDIQVATLTLRFAPEEIGTDFDAAVLLAKRGAATLGADLLFYVSGTEDKNTKSLRSVTFRCVRTRGADYLNKLAKEKIVFENNQKVFSLLRASSKFMKKIDDVMAAFPKGEQDMLRTLGVVTKTLKGKNGPETQYLDHATGEVIPEDEAIRRVNEYMSSRFATVYEENRDLYKEEYPKIIGAIQQYPESDVIFMFPPLNEDGTFAEDPKAAWLKKLDGGEANP